MTKQQVELFKEYVQQKDAEFYLIMDSVFVFAIADEKIDHYYLLENAFQEVLPSESNKQKYLSLLIQYKKENKIYNPVPDIADNFSQFLEINYQQLFMKLDWRFDVVLENGQHNAIINEIATDLSEKDKEEFKQAWIKFNASLIRV